MMKCSDCGQNIPDESPFGICPQCCFSTLPKKDDELIGGIELGEKIGEGTFGEVYHGILLDHSLSEVAVKILREPHLERARFLEEMQIVSLLSHPHIARLLRSGETQDNRPYYAMELVEGVNIDQAKLDPLAAMTQLTEAIAHAHRNGIIHRDLKPTNILVAENGSLKVIDFGIARVFSGPLSLSHQPTQNLRLGSLPYMSPEQLEGDPRIDTLSDIYALGLLFYELVLGRPVLETVTTSKHSWSENARRLKDFEFPRLPRKEWDWVAAKACAFQRRERYQTAEELLGDLKAIQSGTMVSAGKNDQLYRLRKFCRKYRTVLTTTAAAMIFLATVAAFSISMAAKERQAKENISKEMAGRRQAEHETRIAASDARLREANLALTRDQASEALRIIDLALELNPENNQAVYFRNFLLSTRTFSKSLPSPLLDLFVERMEPHPDGFLINGSEVAALEANKTKHPAKDIAITDDGKGLLTFTSKSTGESLLEPLIYGSGFEKASFSPKHGVVAATTATGGVRLWDVSGMRPQAASASITPSATWLTFEREKDTLWLVGEDARLHLWSKTLRPIRLSKVKGFKSEFLQKNSIENRRDFLWKFWQGGNQRGLAGGKGKSFLAMLAIDKHTENQGTSLMISTMARDVDVVVFVDSAGWIGIRNNKGGYDFLPGPRLPVKRLALSANGKRGAIIFESGEIATFSPETQEYIARWTPGSDLRSLALLDNNKLLIAAAEDGGLHFYDPLTGEKPYPSLTSPARQAEIVAIPHRDEFLVCSEGDLHIRRRNAHGGELLHSGMRHREGVLWFSCSLDGQFLFSIDQVNKEPIRGALRVWSLRTGDEVVPALEHHSPINCATIFNNGQRIATAAHDGTVRRWTIEE